MKRDRFKIGDWVYSSLVLKIVRERQVNTWVRRLNLQSADIYGQIVGAAIRYAGTIDGGHYFAPDDYDPAVLNVHLSLNIWLIRTGMTNKPVECPDDGVMLWADHPSKLPWRYQRPMPWTDEDRELLRRESKQWPRDKKGRWM